MIKRGNALVLSAAGILVAAWCVAQFLLARHAAYSEYHRELVDRAAFLARFPQGLAPVVPVRPTFWLWPGWASALAMVALVTVCFALVRGGRVTWAWLPAVLPASLAIGQFEDGTPLGRGWEQPTNSLQTWLAAGTAVDTLVLLLVAAALVLTVRRSTRKSSLPAVVRTMPIAIVITGWWLTGNVFPDAEQRIWITQALLFVLGAALVCTTALPLAGRLAVLMVLPLAQPDLALLVASPHPAGATMYLHHLAVAGAVALYVLGAPALHRLLRQATQRRSSDTAPAH